jgi:peptidoglycan L-alanyl-D-glutamate endopeptidase CwlK
MMSTSIYTLRPEAAAMAEELLKNLVLASIRHKVTCTRRTTEEQLALYSQGRAPLEIVQLLRQHAGLPKIHASENRYTVTQIDGVNKSSAHQEGLAIDITPADEQGNPVWAYAANAERYKAIGKIARRMGWNCGQDWPPIDRRTGLGADPPHYQLG